MNTALVHINIYTQDEILRNGTLVMSDGRIIAVHARERATGGCEKVIDGQGLSAVPGYIDAHCHGGGGFDCNDGTTDSVVGMRDFHGRHGVTALYPTLAVNKLPATRTGMEAVRRAMLRNRPGKTEICGCHLEGPFLNSAFRGSQEEEDIIPMTDDHLRMLSDYHDVVRRITIAPEVSRNVEYLPALREMGMQISIGHSAAEYREAVRAVRMGATSVTHLYNAMSQTRKHGPFRTGGVVEAGLTLDALFAEIIADGYHLTDELIRIAYRCKGAARLSVCSDANRAAGGAHGDVFRSCGVTYVIERGVAMNEARTSLASSVTPIDGMVRYLIFKTGLPAGDVMRMTSGTTARMMGIFDRKGSLDVGKDADINLVDDAFNVVCTFCRGKKT